MRVLPPVIRRTLPWLSLVALAACHTPGGAKSGSVTGPAPAPITDAVREQLGSAKYVYLSSQRATGGWSDPAEIWYFYDQGAVWVGTKPTSWRARRIKAGRANARIAVGKVDGPAFEATGEVVKDPAMEAKLMETFAKKYPDGWRTYEPGFRDGFKTGERLLLRYTPR
jgi:hypothetical protein